MSGAAAGSHTRMSPNEADIDIIISDIGMYLIRRPKRQEWSKDLGEYQVTRQRQTGRSTYLVGLCDAEIEAAVGKIPNQLAGRGGHCHVITVGKNKVNPFLAILYSSSP